MDLITLDDNYQPKKLIEGYDSLIWTERFDAVGDFQIVTGKIDGPDGFLTLLPEGTVVSLRESTVPMIVETHKIERKKNSPAKLIITGREYTSILDRRVVLQSVSALTGSENWDVIVKTPSDLAYYAIVKICVDGILDSADIFPSDKVQFPTPVDYLTSTGPSKTLTINRGNLLSVVTELLQTEAPVDISTFPETPAVVPHGLRAVRPAPGATAIGIIIYTGEDLTNTVYFDATRNLLDDGNYLFSKVGAANAAYGVANGMAGYMYEGASEPTGLDRRVILVDASTSGMATEVVLRHEMSVALSEAHETALFDGSINQDISPYIYGVDYELGDIVRTVGDYGLDAHARVTEYIRTEDATGAKAYPTLSTLNQEVS